VFGNNAPIRAINLFLKPEMMMGLPEFGELMRRRSACPLF